VANAAADLKSLCTAMPFIAGCSVAAACNASGAGATSPAGECLQGTAVLLVVGTLV
jgi:hypothetical protein